MNTCLLCTFKQDCEKKPLVLYPATPIVGELLVKALEEEQIVFRMQDGLLLLDETADERFSAAMRARLSECEWSDIRVTRSPNAEMMNASTLFKWLQHTDTDWFDKALASDRFITWFQPIVDYKNKRIHAHESLIRLTADRVYSGGEIMEAAVSRGRLHVFDSYTRQLSVRCAGAQYVPGTKVFINFMPSSIYDPAFCMKSTMHAMSQNHLTPEDIVFEVVESEAVHDAKHLKKICAYYRDHGFKFALDDVGTGSNSLQMVCDLHPDYIKIDKSLVSGLGDRMYRSTVGKIVDLAGEFNVNVIAEGIEDLATAEICSELGIHLMQGYYFARPAAKMIACASDLINLAHHVNQESEKANAGQSCDPAVINSPVLGKLVP
jgi:EAL domain-containing protein (putative c-di-GMP-specific phosphodiesterase class I)